MGYSSTNSLPKRINGTDAVAVADPVRSGARLSSGNRPGTSGQHQQQVFTDRAGNSYQRGQTG
jgi:hypothetical protein